MDDTLRGSPEQQYLDLKQHLVVLRERRTQLETRLSVQREERMKLEEALVVDGVNTSDLPGEKERLESELREHLTTAREAVGEFADELDSALGDQIDHRVDAAAIELT